MPSNNDKNQTLVNVNSSGAGQPIISKETNTDVNHVKLSHTLLASGEKVLLQTAKVIVSVQLGVKFQHVFCWTVLVKEHLCNLLNNYSYLHNRKNYYLFQLLVGKDLKVWIPMLFSLV